MKTNIELFADVYAATHEAADRQARLLDHRDQLSDRTTRDDLASINRLLRRAICAASALESRLAGNQPPKEG